MDSSSTTSMKRRNSSYDAFRTTSKGKKLYEEMLLKELPGKKESNQPMHAVLESSLDYNDGTIKESQRVRNHALIHYLASLANSNNFEDKFDFDFVESLINNGADINSTDKSGQTVFHEVARSWNSDIASFLIDHGADVNKQDEFGRSPLHVAAAVDHAKMVEFLIKNGADINITTAGEGQMPIHYAAKNDGCNALKMLLGYGANIDSRDSKNRTPLQVAGEMSRTKAAKFLVQNGAPCGVIDRMGNSALVLLIEKIPDVAVEALDQFHSVNSINCKEYFFLNYLEGNRLNDPESPAYSALELAVQNQEFDVILHPVMKRLIFVKWYKFGRYGALTDLIYNFVYAILWSILAVTTPSNKKHWYIPWSENAWRLVIAVLVCSMTVDEIRKQLTGILRSRKRQKKWLTWRATELQEDLAYCHPRWPQEKSYLNSEIEAIQDTPLISTGDAWIYFDWFTLALILATIASHITHVTIMQQLIHTIYLRIITVLLLALWFRMLKFVRPFEGAGPFVVIFLNIFRDIFTWMILVSVIIIPFICAFWITFGTPSLHPVESYSSIMSLIYNMFSMAVVSDHDFESLEQADPIMARILCSSYIAIIAIICLNLLIAVLSDTFSRVYKNAVANAVMQRAKTILLIEKSLSNKKKRAYEEFIKNNGNPEAVDLRNKLSRNSPYDDSKSSESLKENVGEIYGLLSERLGKQYGENQKSDFDVMIENISNIHSQRAQSGLDMKLCKKQLLEIQHILITLCNSQKVFIEDIVFCSDSEEESRRPHIVDDSHLKSYLRSNKFEYSMIDDESHSYPTESAPTTRPCVDLSSYHYQTNGCKEVGRSSRRQSVVPVDKTHGLNTRTKKGQGVTTINNPASRNAERFNGEEIRDGSSNDISDLTDFVLSRSRQKRPRGSVSSRSRGRSCDNPSDASSEEHDTKACTTSSEESSTNESDEKEHGHHERSVIQPRDKPSLRHSLKRRPKEKKEYIVKSEVTDEVQGVQRQPNEYY